MPHDSLPNAFDAYIDAVDAKNLLPWFLRYGEGSPEKAIARAWRQASDLQMLLRWLYRVEMKACARAIHTLTTYALQEFFVDQPEMRESVRLDLEEIDQWLRTGETTWRWTHVESKWKIGGGIDAYFENFAVQHLGYSQEICVEFRKFHFLPTHVLTSRRSHYARFDIRTIEESTVGICLNLYTGMLSVGQFKNAKPHILPAMQYMSDVLKIAFLHAMVRKKYPRPRKDSRKRANRRLCQLIRKHQPMPALPQWIAVGGSANAHG